MLGLPKSTEFNKRIPKQKFYENLEISSVLKKVFVNQIKTIYWRNKIATTTLNLATGTNVTEIEILEINLNNQLLDERVFYQMDKEIPYHILFLLEYQGKYQAWIGYKEVSLSGNATFKVNKYYHTEWMEKDDLPLKLEGLDLDIVYENFVKQIAGDKLQAISKSESLKDTVTREEEKEALRKQINILQSKIKKEKQLNKQMEMNSEIKKLKRELEAM